MTDRDFLDSNILVYAYDRDQPQKQALAQTLLISGIENETSVVSAQVLSEFFTVATRRIPAPLSIDQAEEIINLVGTLPVVELDFSAVWNFLLGLTDSCRRGEGAMLPDYF